MAKFCCDQYFNMRWVYLLWESQCCNMDESLKFLKFAAKKSVTEGEVIEYDVPQLEHRPRIVFF